MRPVRRTLQATIIATVASVVFVTTAALSAVTYWVVDQDTRAARAVVLAAQGSQAIAFDQMNNFLVPTLTEYARTHPGTSTPHGLDQALRDEFGFFYAAVVAPGRSPADCNAPCWQDLPIPAQRAIVARERFVGKGVTADGRADVWVATAPLPDIGDGRLALVEQPSSQPLVPDNKLWFGIGIVAVVGLLLATVAGIGVAYWVRRPALAVTGAAERIRDGEYDVRVPDRGSRELRHLGATINSMATRLATSSAARDAAEARQRRFVADVAHELRSPLSAMVATTDTLTTGRPGTVTPEVRLLSAQTHRLAAMVEDLLVISRFDAGQVELLLEPTDLGRLVEDAAAAVAPLVAIDVSVVGSPWAVVDPRSIHAVMRNLIGNAVQHGQPPIAVRIGPETGDTVQVEVIDQGPGVAPQPATVFDRFVTGSPGRAGPRSGTGLGLAIVRGHVELHRGRAYLAEGGPTRFVVVLPRGMDDYLSDQDTAY